MALRGMIMFNSTVPVFHNKSLSDSTVRDRGRPVSKVTIRSIFCGRFVDPPAMRHASCHFQDGLLRSRFPVLHHHATPTPSSRTAGLHRRPSTQDIHAKEMLPPFQIMDSTYSKTSLQDNQHHQAAGKSVERDIPGPFYLSCALYKKPDRVVHRGSHSRVRRRGWLDSSILSSCGLGPAHRR